MQRPNLLAGGQQVMAKLAANGGKLPPEIKH
jgi:hypothetical protein